MAQKPLVAAQAELFSNSRTLLAIRGENQNLEPAKLHLVDGSCRRVTPLTCPIVLTLKCDGGFLAGVLKFLTRLPRIGTAMTWEAEMTLQTTDTAIAVESANVHLGEGLPIHARESIRRVAGKYFGHLSTASVHFGRESTDYRCTVTMQMGGLPMRSGEATSKDIYAAFDAALSKVAKQLRRAKRALREDQPVRTDKDMVLRAGLGGPPFT